MSNRTTKSPRRKRRKEVPLNRERVHGYDLPLDGPASIPLETGFGMSLMNASRKTCLLCLVLLLVVTEITDGQEGAKTPEAFRLICDQAMPLFLERRPADAVDVLKVVQEPSKHRDLDKASRLFQQMFEYVKHVHGEPVDWQYIGSRPYNSVLTQYIYVCRYQNQPLFFEITGVQSSDQWRLHGFFFHDDVLNAMEDFQPNSRIEDDEQCEERRNEVLNCFTDSMAGADRVLEQMPPQLRAAKPEVENYVRSVFMEAASQGTLQNHHLLYSKTVAGTLAEFAYLLTYSDEPRFLRLFYYNNGNQWKLLSLKYDKDTKVLGRTPIEQQEPIRQARVK